MKKTNELNLTTEVHAMSVCGQMLYISDGKSIYEYEIPRETLWAKIGKLLGIIKYSL